MPLPAKIEIEYAPPLHFDGTGNEDDAVVHGYVDKVKEVIAAMIDSGARRRRGASRRSLHREGAREDPHPGRGRGRSRARSRCGLKAEGHEVVGIDRRPWPDAPDRVPRGRHPQARRRGRLPQGPPGGGRPHGDGDVPRRPRRGALPDQPRRHARGLRASRASTASQHCIFVGRHTFYGAGPDSPLFHTEDEPPLALNRFPELADLVAADLYAAAALWRSPELATTVLRFCYTLGPSNHGTLAGFLRGKRVPMVLGFDPLFQFLHEDDVVRAIVLTLEKRPRGVFNVAGPQPLPLSRVIREAGRTPVPLPEFVLSGMLGRFGLPQLPTGAVTHLKYPVVVDARRLPRSRPASRTSTTSSRPYVRSAKRYRSRLERSRRARFERHRPISFAT